MTKPLTAQPETVLPEFLSGGGVMGELIRSYNWSATLLGAVDTWPQSLRSALSICLNSNFPIAIYWGADLTLLYNDAWSPIPGNKHPWSLGKPAKEVWPEIWEQIEPQFNKAFQGEPGGSKDALLPMQRYGYTEECYFDFTFTPVYGESGKVEGVFNAVIETTYRILSERRSAFLKNLALRIAEAASKAQLFQQAINFIGTAAEDIPLALLYKMADEKPALAASTLLVNQVDDLLKKAWPFAEAAQSGKPYYIKNLNDHLTEAPHNFWPESLTEGCVVPIAATGGTTSFLVCGLSARRRFDDDYASFLEATGAAIATVSNTITSLEEERKKAEALAEIDKAKTAFFTNISHEFRTPLTLMLGSLETLLNQPAASLSANDVTVVEASHRNALRLLRLVNNLLDFSRLEAGHIQGGYRLTNIAALTANLAASFRSAIEAAGLQFTVACEAVSQPVYVDEEMWEKIVLNLLSNAFKYTLEGTITLSLKTKEDNIVLTVSDTGIGIPAAEIPLMFQRFHRVQNSGGRTIEGTGIGLSLVKELVQLHGGTISLSSKVGEGSTFTVTIPTGKEHLKPEQLLHDAALPRNNVTEAFLEEAISLTGQPVIDGDKAVKEGVPTVLIADDNADMRRYMESLLQKQFNVLTATNGADAWQKIKAQKPSIVVSDVMMPVMDGIALLKAVKEEPKTAALPVILVSARAGEEAKVEGFGIGADDYLVKPFSAKELVARISAQVSLARKREAALQNVYRLFDEVPFAVAVLKGEDLVIEFVNQYNLDIWQCKQADVIGRPLFEARPEMRASAELLHHEIYRTGKRFAVNEIAIDINNNGKLQTRYFNSIIDPMFNEEGKMIGQLATSVEVTEQVAARKKIEESEGRFRSLANSMPQVVWTAEPNGEVTYYNDQVLQFDGVQKLPDGNWLWEGMIHPDDLAPTAKAWEEAVRQGSLYEKEQRIKMKNGDYRWHLSRGLLQKNENGEILKWYGTATDIHEQKQTEEELRQVKEQLELTFKNIPSAIYHYGRNGEILYLNQKGAAQLGYASVNDVLAEKDIFQLRKKLNESFDIRNEKGEPLRVEESSAAQAFRTGRPAEVVAQFVSKKGGKSFWVISSSAPLFDEAGNLLMVLTTSTDITEQVTERKKAEESEQRFQAAIAAVQGILWTNNAQGEMEGEQSGWASLTGQTREEYQGYGWAKAVHPDDAQPTVDAWNEAVRERKTFVFEHRVKRRDESWGRYSIRAIPLLNSDGSIRQWVGVHTDITEQRKAEEKIRENESRFRTLAETLPQMIWVSDNKGEMEYYSKEWSDYCGVIDVTKAWEYMIHPEDKTISEKAYAKAYAQGLPFRTEIRLKNKAGDFRWHSSVAEPVKDETGTVLKWVGAITDVHDQKTLTEKLEAEVAERTRELKRSNEDLQQFAHVASHDLKEPVRKVRTFSSRLVEEFGAAVPEKGRLYLSKIEAAAERMYAMIDGVLAYSSLNAMQQGEEAVDLNKTLQQIETDLEIPIQQKEASLVYNQLPEVTGSPILLYQLFYNLINNSLKFTTPGEAPVITITASDAKQNEAAGKNLDAAKAYLKITVRDNGIGFGNEEAGRIFKTFTRLHSKDKYEGTGLGLALCEKIVERHQWPDRSRRQGRRRSGVYGVAAEGVSSE